MPTLSIAEICARAEQMALAGGDARDSRVIDNSMTAEAIFPHALQYASDQLLKSSDAAQQLRTEIPLTFSNGQATIPATVDVLESFASDFAIDLEEDKTDYEVSFLPRALDKNAALFRWMTYFWLGQNGTIHGQYGNGDTVEGAAKLFAPTAPTITAGNVTASQVLIDKTIPLIASILKGEMPLAMLSQVSVAKGRK